MLKKLGATGIGGLVLVLLGVGLVAWQQPIVALGIALAFVGVALVAKGLISNVMSAFGFA
ncbi:hypothetical protein ACFO0N_15865 [Halobium salinum]|uniref:Uncharacterized protein n=1 Tax=Halobium salinum TaxID=1364940 RepID=A0ABD5PFW7_9EURY|nr:hypothetical protein [Halobium salinum]